MARRESSNEHCSRRISRAAFACLNPIFNPVAHADMLKAVKVKKEEKSEREQATLRRSCIIENENARDVVPMIFAALVQMIKLEGAT